MPHSTTHHSRFSGVPRVAVGVLIGLLAGAGALYSAVRTVMYIDSAQTISVKHTFDPTIVGPPFAVGGNAIGQEVLGLRAQDVGADRITTGMLSDGVDVPLAGECLKVAADVNSVEYAACAAAAYATIQEEGASLAQRTTLNMIGASATCTDNAGAARTDCVLTDDDVPEAADYLSLLAAAGLAHAPTGTLATASGEADFLASGLLVCGASAQGKIQVHTTPLQYCDNSATPTLRHAAYGDAAGVAASANALAANGANCAAGNYPLGVDAAGVVESCAPDAFGYDTVQDEAIALTKRPVVNFTGGGVSCVDDPGNLKTNCDIPTQSQNLDQVFTTGATATGVQLGTAKERKYTANAGATSARFGWDPTDGWKEVFSPAADRTIRPETGKDIIFRLPDGTECERITSAGVHTYTGACRPRKSLTWNAGAMSTDSGNSCADATEQVIVSEPNQWAFSCAVAAASQFGGRTVMKDAWDAGTLTFELTVFHAAAEVITLAGDVSAQCIGSGEAMTATWGTAVALDMTTAATANQTVQVTSAAVTAAGTCAAGDLLRWRWVMDNIGSSANAANTKILEMKIEATMTSRSD